MTSPTSDKQSRYLGDGLYADFDGGQVRLFTDGGHDGQQVFLDMPTFEALLKYAGGLHPIFKNIIIDAAKELT